MEFFIHLILIVLYLVGIVFMCQIFTNAIERLGYAFKLAQGAVGSVFAAVGTALPETIVPLIAIIGGYFINHNINSANEIAIGAILGSPFLLSTFALFITGIMIYLFSKWGKRESKIFANPDEMFKNLALFLACYVLSISASFCQIRLIKIGIAILLISAYCLWVRGTIINAKGQNEEEPEELYLERIFKIKTTKASILFQITLSLLILILFVHFFVEEIKFISEFLKINPLIISLIVSPIATELPEITNSILWVRNSKDSLALGNITGAMIFQGSILPSIGILLTPWVFESNSICNIAMVVMSTFFIAFGIFVFKKIQIKTLLIGGGFYLAFLLFVLKNLGVLNIG